jgi:TPR repeat protein
MVPSRTAARAPRSYERHLSARSRMPAMLPRLTLLRLAFVAALAATPASAEPEHAGRSFDVAAAQRVATAIDSDPALVPVYGQCPADLFRSRTRMSASFIRVARGSDKSCDTRVGHCFSGCMGGDGNSCLRLAYVFQRNKDHVAPRVYEPLFTLACAAGEAAGCTNRAAGIRNGDYADDPFRERPEAERETCQFRSFKLSCREGDSWGCYMLGQSHRYGEGTRRSAAKARGAYRKTCRLAPDFESCEYAREALQEIRTAAR